jgi:TolB-like protein/DNA-binding winged helix-turn-helix (wHTH) protein
MEAPVQQRYSFGPFVLDPAEKVLLRKGHAVVLPPKALETLLVLVEKHGHITEKAELFQRVWPDTFVEEATLTQNIFTLRKILNGSSGGSQYIETVPKRGYRFIASINIGVGPQEVGPLGGQFAPRKLLERRLLWAGVFLVAAVVGGALLLLNRSRGAAVSPSSGRVMLAVLPFENLSGDLTQEYFGDGLTEELIAQLSRLYPERLRVIARTSAMQYKGVSKTVVQIGRELGVDYILESSFRREGARVRITTQLVRVSDQTHMWAQSYEREAPGVLTLQKDVATDVATHIAMKLNSSSTERSANLNVDAYEAYLKGRFFWNKRSEQGHLKAIEYFNQAIATDPGYAQAYSGLADAYALLGSNPTTAITRHEAMFRARDAALKALALDDALAEAHTSLAFVYWHYDWNWPAGEKEFQRALQLNPSYPTAHHWYAYYLVSQGRIDQALEEIRRAQETDPLSVIINTDVAQILYFAHRYDQAIAQAKRALEMDPQFSLARLALAGCYLEKHQHEMAVEEAKKAADAPGAGPDIKADSAATYATAGRETQARGLLLMLKADSERQHAGQPFFVPLAGVYASLGEKDQAFAWLEKDFQNRNGGLTLIKVTPHFASLRGDPRFVDLVRRIGLPSAP